MDGAVIKQCGEDAIHLDCEILQTLESETTHMAIEESDLVDLDDATVGDRPYIKIMVCPDECEHHPIDQEPER